MQDIIFDNVEKFQEILEYDFYLTNLIGITDKGVKVKIFIKTIKKGKIKESLFCICNLAYEKYFNKNCYSNDNSKKIQKISITEERRNIKNVNKVSVKLFKNNVEIVKAKMDIYFIEISKYIEQVKNIGKEFEINPSEIVIVGVKNKH